MLRIIHGSHDHKVQVVALVVTSAEGNRGAPCKKSGVATVSTIFRAINPFCAGQCLQRLAKDTRHEGSRVVIPEANARKQASVFIVRSFVNASREL